MVIEQILHKVRNFTAWWRGLNLFGQKLPVVLAFILFVALVFHLFFEVKDSLIILKNPIQAVISDGVRNLGLLLAASIGWFFLYWRAKTTDLNVEAAEQSAEATRKNAELAEKGLITDRLTRAIEQIAHEKPYMRVGGIRDLEQIADTQEEERMKIAHILASFIRTQAVKNYKENELMMKEEFDAHREKRLDIEIAVTVLSRIASKLEKQKQFEQHSENKYDLCSLENLDLRGLRFEGVDLSKFALEGTDFSGAWLRGANFTNAHLFKFFGIKILRAIFFRAHLHHANFTHAYLNHAIFTEADLTATRFDNVILQNAVFDGAVVNGTHFECSQCLTQEQINKTYYCGEPPHLSGGLELPQKESYYRMEHIP